MRRRQTPAIAPKRGCSAAGGACLKGPVRLDAPPDDEPLISRGLNVELWRRSPRPRGIPRISQPPADGLVYYLAALLAPERVFGNVHLDRENAAALWQLDGDTVPSALEVPVTVHNRYLEAVTSP